MWTPPTKETRELEERTGKNAEDFLDDKEPRQHPSDWEGWDDDQEDAE